MVYSGARLEEGVGALEKDPAPWMPVHLTGMNR